MSLHALVKECCAIVRAETDEHDASDVLACLQRKHSAEIEQFSKALTQNALEKMVKHELKRGASVDHLDQGDQLKLAGFDTLPQSLSFYDGHKVRYISTLRARPMHLRSAIQLRFDAAKFNDSKARDFQKALELIEKCGKPDATFAEALEAMNIGTPQPG